MHLFQSIALKRLGDCPLIRVVHALDWEPVANILEPEVKRARQRKGGRDPYDKMAMFRALLLGEWFRLSYGKLAQAMRVRLDFVLFCGFDAFANLPDASTLNRFELHLERTGLAKKAMEAVSDQLKQCGIELIPTCGALRDPAIRFGRFSRWE